MSNFFEKWASESEERQKLLAEEAFILDVTENVWEEMQRMGINKVQLAERLGKSKPYVSQLLNGSRNMTLRSLADICFALGVEPVINLESPKDDSLDENGWEYSGNVISLQNYVAKQQVMYIPEQNTGNHWVEAVL